MEGTSDDIDNETMDKLVKRDLIMNVRKDGQWGSYRHMPMTGGNYRILSALERLFFPSR